MARPRRIIITSPTNDYDNFYRCKRCLDEAGIPFNRIEQAKSGTISVYVKDHFLSATLKVLRSAGIVRAAPISLSERVRQYFHRFRANLRSESVSVKRRPVAGERPVTDASFTDKVVEVTETDEEPVISKQAHIKEEVVIHKDATERTETVRDSVRREEAEVTKDAAEDTAATPGVTARLTIDPDVPKR
jgi:uncharacterized protein (TIGR02271 family)